MNRIARRMEPFYRSAGHVADRRAALAAGRLARLAAYWAISLTLKRPLLLGLVTKNAEVD
jgi:hypothetical protein